jgi:hypothetical protein
MVRSVSIVAFTAVVLAIGCESKLTAPPTAEVSGTVTLDGKPLADGDVMFANPAGGFPPDVLAVKNGAFKGMAKTGKAKVEIRAYRPATKKPTTAESVAGPENYLPARFNTASTLTAEITATGLNPATFEVQAK